MKRGDIYLVSLDPTRGHEQRRYRPVVVVSATEFNQVSKLAVILPVTTRSEFARRHGFAVPITGVETAEVVRCDQPHVLNLAAPNGRKVGALPQPILDEVLARTITLFE